MKLNKKSQFAIEFVILIAFMFIIFVGFFAIVSYKLIEEEEGEKQQKAENIATLVDNEIKLAKSVNNGYKRTFKLPTKIDGNDYDIEIVDNRELVVNYLEYEYVLFLPENLEGNIGRGLNEITKIDDIVYLNNTEPLSECSDDIDNDGDGEIDLADAGCISENDNDETNCEDGVCEGGESCLTCSSDCGTCLILFLMKGLSNVISFDNDGNVLLNGTLKQGQSSINPAPGQDEFILKDSITGNVVAMVRLQTGNMFIGGSLFDNQPTLTNPATNDFIVKDSDGNIVSYIDESGNFYLKGTLTEEADP